MTSETNQTAETQAAMDELREDSSRDAAAQADNVTPLNADAETTVGTENAGPNWKEETARALAELENARKRHAKELTDARQFAVSRFALEMLNVADNIKRAQEAMPAELDGEAQKIKEGVAMVAHQFNQSLEKFQIKRIDAMGAALNPEMHQAMQQVPSDKPEGEVVAEMQAGYMIGERLLRPALVVVSNGEKPTE